MSNDFIAHAVSIFNQLNWRPAAPDQLSKPDLVVYGNLDKHAQGTVCVIDTSEHLFKIEINERSANEVMRVIFVVRYLDDKEAIEKFNHYLDVLGGFYKEVWLGG